MMMQFVDYPDSDSIIPILDSKTHLIPSRRKERGEIISLFFFFLLSKILGSEAKTTSKITLM